MNWLKGKHKNAPGGSDSQQQWRILCVQIIRWEDLMLNLGYLFDWIWDQYWTGLWKKGSERGSRGRIYWGGRPSTNVSTFSSDFFIAGLPTPRKALSPLISTHAPQHSGCPSTYTHTHTQQIINKKLFSESNNEKQKPRKISHICHRKKGVKKIMTAITIII